VYLLEIADNAAVADINVGNVNDAKARMGPPPAIPFGFSDRT
jgi:hypothetical protein